MMHPPAPPHTAVRIRLPQVDEDAKAAVLASLDELRDALPQMQATCSDRSPLLCIAAWLLWAGGKRPHALAYLAEASHDKSSGALVEALRKHMEATVPLWLGDLPRLAPAMPGGANA